MTYNAEGEILLPFVTHLPDIPQAVLDHFDQKINFFKTHDGNMDRNTLSLLMLSIKL